jgi:hypothetical protein
MSYTACKRGGYGIMIIEEEKNKIIEGRNE